MPRLYREVLDELLERVVAGQYPPGAKLPKEVDVAAEFDVSRGTAREALRALEERRVAVVKHGRGATVQPSLEWNVLDPAVAGALARGRKRRAFLDEVAASRAALRVEAAGLAAERANQRQRRAIAAAAAAVSSADASGPARGDVWQLVVEAAGNRPIAATLRSLADIDEAAADGPAEAYARLADAVAAADTAAAREAAREAG